MGYHQNRQSPMNQKKLLNLVLDVFVIDAQQISTKGQSKLQKTGHLIGEYSFYAPNEIAENITHSWEEHDSVVGRVAQIATDFQSGVAEVGKAAGGKTASSGDFKIDSPLVWKNSPRREYSFPITLLDQNNPASIVNVVKDLKMMSSAKTDAGFGRIEYPYIFRVRFSPSGLIAIESAALTGVQSTYHYPYMDGMPTKIDLQLTFMDLEPLFEHSFAAEGAPKVTTGPPLERGV